MKDDPAFPEINSHEYRSEWNNSPLTRVQSYGGLTKREWFAGLALQGILSNASGIGEPEHWARYAVRYGDAILAELDKPSEVK